MVGVCGEEGGDSCGKWEEMVVEFDVVGKWRGSETCGVEMGNDIAKESVVRKCVCPVMVVNVVGGSGRGDVFNLD